MAWHCMAWHGMTRRGEAKNIQVFRFRERVGRRVARVASSVGGTEDKEQVVIRDFMRIILVIAA